MYIIIITHAIFIIVETLRADFLYGVRSRPLDI